MLARAAKIWMCLVLALVVTACSVPDATAPAGERGAAAGLHSDRAIAEAVYFDRRTPVGFYTESLPAGYADSFLTAYHVTSNQAGLSGTDRRLCSDDFAEAHAWAEAAAGAQPLYRNLVDTRVTDLYYEFVRSHPQQPQVVHLARIYRCSRYLPAVAQVSAARITATPLLAETVRRVLEYDWWFTRANNYGVAVIEANVLARAQAWVHGMLQAELTPVADGCDRIDLFRERRNVDAFDGEVSASRMWERAIYARYEAGAVSLCAS